jgi:hypothetical protein
MPTRQVDLFGHSSHSEILSTLVCLCCPQLINILVGGLRQQAPSTPDGLLYWRLCDVKSRPDFVGSFSKLNRCKREWMETIIVSWQNGIRFSVKRKLSLHKCFNSKISWNEYTVLNWRYHCKIVFKVFLSKCFATHFYPLQTIVSLQVDRFCTVSLQVDHFSSISKAL